MGLQLSRNTVQVVDRLAHKIQGSVSFYLLSLNIERFAFLVFNSTRQYNLIHECKYCKANFFFISVYVMWYTLRYLLTEVSCLLTELPTMPNLGKNETCDNYWCRIHNFDFLKWDPHTVYHWAWKWPEENHFWGWKE